VVVALCAAYYSERNQEVDYFLSLYPDAHVIFAAGNSGAVGMGTVYTPCDAKNVLCVGSSDSRDDVSDEPMTSLQVSFFSSMGPTFDGRFKPDVLGPGFKTVSAMSGADGSSSATMTCATTEMFGTSMAAPAVAGIALLAREYFRTKWALYCRDSYSSCKSLTIPGLLLKAVLIHSATAATRYSSVEFDGKTALDSFPLSAPPDSVQGFGQVVLGDVLPLSAGSKRDLYLADTFLASKSLYELEVQVSSDDYPLVVTVAWYDVPSVVGTASTLLINNVDLIVIAPGGEALPGNGQFDAVNTVERVFIQRPVADTYTVLLKTGTLYGGKAQRVGLVITCAGYVKSEPVLSTRRLESVFEERNRSPTEPAEDSARESPQSQRLVQEDGSQAAARAATSELRGSVVSSLSSTAGPAHGRK
jgi:hypothetical protein